METALALVALLLTTLSLAQAQGKVCQCGALQQCMTSEFGPVETPQDTSCNQKCDSRLGSYKDAIMACPGMEEHEGPSKSQRQHQMIQCLVENGVCTPASRLRRASIDSNGGINEGGRRGGGRRNQRGPSRAMRKMLQAMPQEVKDFHDCVKECRREKKTARRENHNEKKVIKSLKQCATKLGCDLGNGSQNLRNAKQTCRRNASLVSPMRGGGGKAEMVQKCECFRAAARLSESDLSCRSGNGGGHRRNRNRNRE